MSQVLLVEINATSPAGAAAVLRFTDRAIAPFPPNDPDRPNARFESRVVEAPSLRRLLFEDLSTLTPSLGVGVLQLANADHGLDAYQGYVWNDITVSLWAPGTPFAAAAAIYKGLCAAPSFPVGGDRPSRVSVGLYDYRLELSKPLQSNVYAGSNGVGGVLYEGAPDGIKGQPKPLAYGNLRDAQIPAPQVNAGVQAYQLHDGKVQGSEQLFDRGDVAGDADDGDFVGAAFDGHAPAAAHYCTDVGRGLVKLTGAPVGQLTFGLKGDAIDGNLVANNTFTGAVVGRVGVDGTLPPGWAVLDGAQITDVVSLGTRAGMPVMRVRLQYANASGVTKFPGLVVKAAAAPATTYACSFSYDEIGYAGPAGKQAEVQARGAGGAFLSTMAAAAYTGGFARQLLTGTAPASTIELWHLYYVTLPTGQNLDWTFEIGGEQIVEGASAGPLVATSGTPVPSYLETAGPILARLLGKAGVPTARIGASVAALAAPAVVGIYVGDGGNADQVIAQVAASAPAAVLPDRLGVWQAITFGPPAAVADVAIGATQVINCESDDSAPLPVGEVRVGWGQIWQTFTGNDLAPALGGTTSQERLANEFRWAIATDATVKARLPSSWRSIEIKTALRNEADAIALANALKAMFGLRPDGSPRRFWRVTVELSTALGQALGKTVQVTYPAYGIAGNFLLVGEELLRPRRDQAVWTLWG